MSNPKAFVSHASEDKERFVTDLAHKLVANGVEAWYDEWEIHPGDSIVRKVFMEGLDRSKVFIAVLSSTSINKKWVKEELDAAIVKKIEEAAKIIPIVLDNLKHEEIPLPLRAIRYVRIADISSYDNELHDILQAIYETTNKPALGQAPGYLINSYPSIPGLNNTDSLVLKLVGDATLAIGLPTIINVESLQTEAKASGLAESVLKDSIQILEANSIVEIKGFFGHPVAMVKMTTYGFDTYLENYYEGYPDLIRDVALQIVNENKRQSEEIASALSLPDLVVTHIFEMLQTHNMIMMRSMFSGRAIASILDVKPTLRRWLDEDTAL